MITNREPLGQNAMYSLPMGRILPGGWLREQLRIQAQGFSGLLPEYWEPLGANSGWLGGTGESWERGPYYLDGLLPLAWLLEDDALKARAQEWIEWTLGSQREDGMFGPAASDDWWPRMVMMKVLCQYHELTEDPRVIPFMLRYLRHMDRHIDGRPLTEWGQARGGEAILSALWLYNRTGEAFLLDLARRLHRQTLDWTGIFSAFPYWRYQTRFDHRVHVVNVAMALKEPALYGLISGASTHREASQKGIEALTLYHGQLNGTFSGDEWLAGTSPSQGTELCAVAEYMFTLENLYAISGRGTQFDILERLAFNALPAAITPDWMAHQYVQQVNQIACNAAHRNWTENRDDANMYGLEPNFGCCTANMHQAWPKFTASLWHQKGEDSYVVSSYAPCTVILEGGGRFDTKGRYPFGGKVRIGYSGPARELSVSLRKPGWCEDISVACGEERFSFADEFKTIRKVFAEGDTLEVDLPMVPRAEARANGAVGVFRGPLLFSLPLKGRWWRRSGSLPFVDYEVFLMDGEVWNYALRLDLEDVPSCVKVQEHAIARQPFQSDEPPVTLHIKAAQCDAWREERYSAGELPQSPVKASSPIRPITLMPYGGCKLRVTEMPVLGEERADETI